MRKLLGSAVTLLALYLGLVLGDWLGFAPGAGSGDNQFDLAQNIGFFGVISLAAGLLIIAGGIDLSIGSVVAFTGAVLAILVSKHGWPFGLAMVAVLVIGGLIGLMNGLLVTYLRVQPFIVTLCGLFIYRGAARWVADDSEVSIDVRVYADLLNFFREGKVFGLPLFLVLFAVLAGAASVFLHLSVYGRYLFAIGSNERAARYSGIPTDRYRVLAFVLCSTLTALFGVLLLLSTNSVQPSSTGNFYELYAIAGAVLGGCSLRGGEGTVLGILLGTAILWILPNMINMFGIPSALEYAVIGLALLFGAVLDEFLRSGRRVRSG
jgi:ribose transport system permease protein